MKRKIDAALEAWRKSPVRKPLIVNGARQVGKTYSVLEFGRAHFKDTVHVDFVASRSACAIFQGDITPQALIPQIEALTGKALAADTLLFLDEAQACPRAITALKYFADLAPNLHVIAAGSLLGLSIKRDEESYPVGKVDTIDLHPLDFEEFLWAAGQERLAGLIRESYNADKPLALHEQALGLYRKYLFVGGMPEAVATSFKLTGQGIDYPHDFPYDLASPSGDAFVRNIQNSILDGYLADMTKYAAPIDGAKIHATWHAVPQQLAKENHKFQYQTIEKSARKNRYASAIAWLEDAGIVTACPRVTDAIHPLPAFREEGAFKLYLLDVGLLGALQDTEPADFLPQEGKTARLRGAMAENYVMQQLVAGGMSPYFWGTSSKAEVEFVVELPGVGVVPIEVKSGKNVTSRSLAAFREKYQCAYLMRVSAKNFGFENGIRSVPLYAAFCIPEANKRRTIVAN